MVEYGDNCIGGARIKTSVEDNAKLDYNGCNHGWSRTNS